MSNIGEGPLSRFSRVKRPVAREEGLLVEQLEDETVVYDSRTKEAHCLSPLAAIVFNHCDGHTTLEQLATLATERLGEPVDESGVIDALAQLQERDLLAVPPRDGLSRRQMIGKSAAAAGAFAGVSLITTIAAPAAIAASQGCGSAVCCPCVSPAGGCDSGLAKQDCCDSIDATQCECSQAASRTTGLCSPCTAGKYCKPSGTGPFTDQLCNCIYSGVCGGLTPPPGFPTPAAFRLQCAQRQASSTLFPQGAQGCRCATGLQATCVNPPCPGETGGRPCPGGTPCP